MVGMRAGALVASGLTLVLASPAVSVSDEAVSLAAAVAPSALSAVSTVTSAVESAWLRVASRLPSSTLVATALEIIELA